MKQISFTDKSIDGLPIPETGQVDYYDLATSRGSVRRFGIRVSYGGTKTWFVRYPWEGKQRRKNLGRYREMSLAEARKKAFDLKHGIVVEGIDPDAAARAERQALTFKALAELYIEEHAKAKKRSWPEDERILNKYFSSWHPRKAAEIDRAEIVERLQDIKKKNGPIMANRCLATVRKMYSYALKNAKLPLPYNPFLRLDPPGDETDRDRVYSNEELKSLWDAFGECGTAGAVFKMCLITGQRLSECAGMDKKSEIDGDLWTMPGARTKNKRVHVVPLNDMALDLLEEQKPSHEQWVFPSPKKLDQPISNFGRAARGRNGKNGKPTHRNVRILSGVEDFQPHDLRRTMSTNLTRLGFTRFVADRLLNHAEPGVGGVYDRHDYLREKTEAMDAWGRYLRGVVDEDKTVVQLAPKKRG